MENRIELRGLRKPFGGKTALDGLTLDMLTAQKPRGVYMSALKTGKLVLYNDRMAVSEITLRDGRVIRMEPVSIQIVPGTQNQ